MYFHLEQVCRVRAVRANHLVAKVLQRITPFQSKRPLADLEDVHFDDARLISPRADKLPIMTTVDRTHHIQPYFINYRRANANKPQITLSTKLFCWVLIDLDMNLGMQEYMIYHE